MRISDWSSDVCSSDLFDSIDRHGYAFRAALEARSADPDLRAVWEEGRDDYARQVARMITAERRAGHAPAGADAHALARMLPERSEGRRDGEQCVRTCRFRCTPSPSTKKKPHEY